jgi:hypothetical protein
VKHTIDTGSEKREVKGENHFSSFVDFEARSENKIGMI